MTEYSTVPKSKQTALGLYVTAKEEKWKTEPDKINSAPHETWIIKVELSNPGELDSLLDAAKYESFISEEQ